jgi:hypothetical protein
MAEGVSFVRMFYNETEPNVHRTHEDGDRIAKMILSYKNHRWLYEREWRMFAALGKAYYRDTASVTSVYLGSRITDSDRDKITDRLSRLRIKTHIMTIKKYSISFEAHSR